MTKDINEKFVFVRGVDADSEPFLFIGVPKGAWELMKNGKMSMLNMQTIGIKLKLVIVGGATNDEIMGSIRELGIDPSAMELVQGTGHTRSGVKGNDIGKRTGNH